MLITLRGMLCIYGVHILHSMFEIEQENANVHVIICIVNLYCIYIHSHAQQCAYISVLLINACTCSSKSCITHTLWQQGRNIDPIIWLLECPIVVFSCSCRALLSVIKNETRFMNRCVGVTMQNVLVCFCVYTAFQKVWD